MTTTTDALSIERREAFARTRANLAAIDADAPRLHAERIAAEIARVTEAETRAQAEFTELASAISVRQRGVGDQLDASRAAQAILDGVDVVDVVEPLETLEARKAALGAGLRGLRERRRALEDARGAGKTELKGALGAALDPLAECLADEAAEIAARLMGLYADVSVALAMGSNEALATLQRALRDPIGLLARSNLLERSPVAPGGQVLAALQAGEAALLQLHPRGLPQEISVPAYEEPANPYLAHAAAAAARGR
jgi:hypothetical protein